MRLVVQKYGGTSVGTPERIRNVARRLLETQREGSEVVAVISAMAGVTDELVKLAHQISSRPTEREVDILLATGEHAATALTAMAVNALGGRAISLTGAESGILTDRNHTKARIANISPKQIHELLSDDYIVIVAGFQGQTPEGEITTLGRGGSDLTAIALAGALNADVCQIFTDVEGVFTCDPRVVTDAKKLDEVAYDELLEMASAGSKVMQSRAVEFAKKFGIEFEVRSSLRTSAGTIAKEETPSMEDVVVRGISLDRHQAKLTVAGVRDKPGNAGRIFSNIAAAHIIVDMIVQNASIGGTTDVSFTIHEDELENARTILMPVVSEVGAKRLNTASGMAKLSVVGIGMRSHSGVAARMFECLGRGEINIQLVSTSEIKIAVIIDEKDAERAAQLIHAEFGLARLMPAAGVPQALSAFKTDEMGPGVARPQPPKEVPGPKQRGRRRGTPKV
jgi:aspartate kinase